MHHARTPTHTLRNARSFNQALEVPLGAAPHANIYNIESFSGAMFEGKPIGTSKACYGCTAADGSSCGGALSLADAGSAGKASPTPAL